MEVHTVNVRRAIEDFGSDAQKGLSSSQAASALEKHGKNVLSERKKKGLFAKILDALKEPMLIILSFGFVVAFGAKLGMFFKTGEADFSECLGIMIAIVLSVSVTLIMEGSSARAFKALGKVYGNLSVKAIRDGSILKIERRFIVPGDVVLLDTGDKIVADGRVIEASELSIDESALTGESAAVKKQADVTLGSATPLAERVNCVYSGTFVTGGSGKMLVTATGDFTEIGKIAEELSGEVKGNSPLQQKLYGLGKAITVIGAAVSVLVLILSVARTLAAGGLSFDTFQELVISAIILIVAAVPEGLPAIVAVSLALNMIKLAKGNALIKKMTATETMGSVSVICSDKTGTLTENRMTVTHFCDRSGCRRPGAVTEDYILQNFICNSTAEILTDGRKIEYMGNGTECALIAAVQNRTGISYKDYREGHPVLYREPFSSETKRMVTTISVGGFKRTLLKGAPEKVFAACDLGHAERRKLESDIEKYQQRAARVLCFAHADGGNENMIFDGYAVMSDPVRADVAEAVSACRSAGIKVKILTGDNLATAYSVAQELKIASNKSQAVNTADIEGLDDASFKRALKKITVIARSTPALKLRVVRALKESGEVVAVTGDGINDAPALRHADVGVAMGIGGSEIAKEAADVVLLDDSFATVVKAIAFGRSVYKNLQRFITFQLTVNLTALMLVTACAVFGLSAPFNTLQLLWINLIMDGPPALTLGLEGSGDKLSGAMPIKRGQSIVSFKMFLRIACTGAVMSAALTCQTFFNWLKVPFNEEKSVVFTLFILFQLFNAFNSRELGTESIFKNVGKNKIMLWTFASVFIVHVIIVQAFSGVFGVDPLSAVTWIKCIVVAFGIVVASEVFKWLYRAFVGVKYASSSSKKALNVNKNALGSID